MAIMKLDHWVSLTEEQRNKLRRKTMDCSKGLDEVAEALREAADRFREEFGDEPRVTHVGYGRFCIVVKTHLYADQLIESLPAKYCELPVQQFPFLDLRDYCLRTFEEFTGRLLGWTKEQAHEWAYSKFRDDLELGIGLLYHDKPYRALSLLLTPVELRNVKDWYETWPPPLSPTQNLPLWSRVARILHQSGSDPFWLSPYDWDGAKAKIDAAIERCRKKVSKEEQESKLEDD